MESLLINGCNNQLKLELVYFPKGKYGVYPQMVYRLAIDIVMPPPPILDDRKNHFRSHFSTFQFNTQFFLNAILDDRKSLSIAFLAISDQCATSNFFKFCSQNGCRRPFWMTENHFQSLFFTKWLPVAILDDRNSLLIAFFAISDQYATLFFFTKWMPAAILNDQKSLSKVHSSKWQSHSNTC